MKSECVSFIYFHLYSGRSGQDDVNLDDVYEKISDDELDFFDEDSSKANKPASLEDLDWSALAAIAPPSKKGMRMTS